MAAPVLDIGKIINRNTVKTPKPAGNPGKFLHLRHGDVIPCEVKSIDERGVTIETPLSAATFVGHDQIKAVELIKSKGTPKLARLKRERLLTLPRMQKDLPPTQLLSPSAAAAIFARTHHGDGRRDDPCGGSARSAQDPSQPRGTNHLVAC
ncbi:MAG: hypothetical protein U0872_02840 [Planctomycetaceae bacterium]